MEEQFAAYQKAALRMKDKPVIIRTLELVAIRDSYLNMKAEENPFMGFRAIRYCLNKAEQLFSSALFSSTAFGDIKIMLLLLLLLTRSVRQRLVEECKRELDAEGVVNKRDIEVGTMKPHLHAS